MKQIAIYYTDDDQDDINFFTDAVDKIASDLNLIINLHIFTSGESYLQAIADNALSNGILFLDITLPTKSGFDVLEALSNHPEKNSYPVIMYSSSIDEDFMKRSQLFGASKYVIKPYHFNDLMKMITHIITTDWQTHQVTAQNFIYSKDCI